MKFWLDYWRAFSYIAEDSFSLAILAAPFGFSSFEKLSGRQPSQTKRSLVLKLLFAI
jgi:hypothetical protein